MVCKEISNFVMCGLQESTIEFHETDNGWRAKQRQQRQKKNRIIVKMVKGVLVFKKVITRALG